jgi:hypothetical protein
MSGFPIKQGATILGKDQRTGTYVVVADTNRQSGMYILGVQGVGKSSLIEQLIYQDIAKGYSVIVLDPHGDLVDHCIAQMPENRLSNAFLLDMEDETFPFGLNLLSSKGKRASKEEAQAVDRCMHVFEAVWGDVLAQQNLPRYLRAGILALREHRGMTLLDLYAFLQDEEYRERILSKVQDASIKQFWEYQYDSLTPAARRREIASLLNRLEGLFMGRPLVRNILGQGETSLDFRAAIEERAIIFIRLPIKTLPQDARLIGTMLVAEIYSAIFSFADTPLEKRPGFSLFVDEFQHFATSDFSEMFTEGRKFGSRVCVAHQFRGQLPDTLSSATLTAYTKICFQTTPEDAPKMAPLFVTKEEQVDKETIVPDVVKHLLQQGHSHPTVEKFIKVYLRPISVYPKNKGFILIATSDSKVSVHDPIPFLSPFLYEVQKKENWQLPIPLEVIYGFSNLGDGYYDVLDRCSASQLTALTKADTVASLTGETEASITLPGPSEHVRELWDFLVTLRQVMVILATSPLGQKKQVTSSEVAQRILDLPKRHAFVRGSKGVTPIVTLPIPTVVSPQEEAKRKAAIVERTRKTYCKPRSLVEKEIEDRHGSHNPASSAHTEQQAKTEKTSVCPHCKKEQVNKQFCSLCGQDMTKAPRQPRFTEMDDE